jgi:pyridoxal phosphate enzyme (YggS family)
MDPRAIIAGNLERIRDRIAAAAHQAGRRPEEVTLVGVTKYVDAKMARLLVECGCIDLGESRPQSLWEKAEQLADLPIRWHLIGHLQRNKLKRTLPHVAMLHSGDSARLLKDMSDELVSTNRMLDVLLEVNISGDPAKHGFSPINVRSSLDQIASLPGLTIHGLMAMAGLEGGVHRARRDFAALRELRDQIVRDCSNSLTLKDLSMGMSADFVDAIAEGATLIRIGSALWEGLEGE